MGSTNKRIHKKKNNLCSNLVVLVVVLVLVVLVLVLVVLVLVVLVVQVIKNTPCLSRVVPT